MKYKLKVLKKLVVAFLICSLFFSLLNSGLTINVHADESEMNAPELLIPDSIENEENTPPDPLVPDSLEDEENTPELLLPESVESEGTMPKLLITEIVANSSGTGELYEYIELYNATNERISLDGYQLQYFTRDVENFPPPANNTWRISGKSIEANSSFVLWLRKLNDLNSLLSDFNDNYGVQLVPEQVFEVRLTTAAQGLANAAKRKVAIATPDGTVISEALINDGDGTADGASANKDKSVIYKYVSGLQMERIANGQTATPGVLTPNQTSRPSAPSNISVEPGNQSVQLSWQSSNVAFKVYYYSVVAQMITVVDVQEETKIQLPDLTNNIDYVFWVTAIDEFGVESSASYMVKTMPMDTTDLSPPAKPSGLASEAGSNRITLTWNASTELNVAGYKVYVDGVLFDTVIAPTNTIVISQLKYRQLYEFEVTAFNFAGKESDFSEPLLAGPSDALPELLITELVADTDNFASYDAFEFIELYNNSNSAIDLNGYTINSGWEQRINRSIIIHPGEVIVLWTRRAEIAPITLEAFNHYYFGSYKSKYLSEEHVYIVHNVGGLVNGGATVSIKDSEGIEISRASYIQADAPLNKSVVFSYPTDGSNVMKPLAAAQQMTPGSVKPEQIPDKRDGNAPQTPSDVKVTAGSGTAKISWSPNSESNLFKYNIYKNSQLEYSVPASTSEFIIYELTGNLEYQIEVSAVDSLGNESEKSAPVSVTPTHLNITQEERTSNLNDPKYQTVWDISVEGPVIPGLVQDLIPQGMTYYKEKDWLLTVYYRNDERPGVLTVVDAKTDQLIKSVHLYNEDKTAYQGHAGGVVVSDKHVMISSESYMFLIDLDDLIDAKDNDEIVFKGRITVDLDAAFAAVNDGVLWVGEFFHPTAYPTDPSHHIQGRDDTTYYAWMEGFVLDQTTGLPASHKWNGEISTAAIPDYVLVIPDRIQGAVFVDDMIILSQSYGRNNDSTLFRYRNPLSEEAHRMVSVGDQSVPTWFLDGQSLTKENNKLTIIPMSEGLTARDGYLYVMLESGANHYRFTTTYIMDRMLKLHLDQWDKFGVKYIDGLSSVMSVGNSMQAGVVEGRGKHEPVDHSLAYQFSSSNPEVITITDDGKATAKKAGDAIITAVSGEHTLSFSVKVTPVIEPPVIEPPVIEPPVIVPPLTPSPPNIASTETKPLISHVNAIEQQAIERMVEQYGKQANALLTVLGHAFVYHAEEDNKTQKINIPVQLPENVPVGVYQVGSNNELIFIGGKQVGNSIEVELTQGGTYVILSYDKSYADVDSSHWAYGAIRQLSAMQIVNGVNETDFEPKKDVTRAEFITMLVRALGLEAKKAANFTDVPANSWFADSMTAAIEAGLILGMDDKTLAPNAKLTREQMALLLVRAYQIKTGKTIAIESVLPFSDLDEVSPWAKEGLNTAYQLNLVSGHANGTFMPKDTTLRAEAITAIINYLIATGSWIKEEN